MSLIKFPVVLSVAALFAVACNDSGSSSQQTATTDSTATKDTAKKAEPKPISEPLVTNIYTADPSAHVFNGKIYIYPSHDTAMGTPENDMGDHFDMQDYHILSMDNIGGKVTDNGVAITKKDIPWVGRQLWAP